MRFKRPRRSGKALVVIDITSLVDVVFLLLIFLLVTTTFKREEHAFPIELPTSSMEQVSVTTDKTTVFVTKDGELHLLVVPSDLAPGEAREARAEKVTKEALEARLREIHARHPDAAIALRGEKDTPYQKMIDVVAVVEGAGFTNLWFPYEQETTP